jgi:hypothetical protein
MGTVLECAERKLKSEHTRLTNAMAKARKLKEMFETKTRPDFGDKPRSVGHRLAEQPDFSERLKYLVGAQPLFTGSPPPFLSAITEWAADNDLPRLSRVSPFFEAIVLVFFYNIPDTFELANACNRWIQTNNSDELMKFRDLVLQQVKSFSHLQKQIVQLREAVAERDRKIYHLQHRKRKLVEVAAIDSDKEDFE